MQSVKVGRKLLLEKIKLNRENHRDLFLKAQDGYRKKVVEELDQMLSEARRGKPIRRALTLPEPQDHTQDYDRVISTLEMSVEENVEVTATEFDMYVMDNWTWKPMAMASNLRYTGGGMK